jgi:hypothetical protein
MIIKTISFSARSTLNLTNYNSLSVERKIEADVLIDDGLEQCNRQLRKDVWGLLDKDIKIIKTKLKEVINNG